jgi:thiamine-phosphate pyrophosphorylase
MQPMDSPGAIRRERLARARLYLICDSAPAGRDLAQVLPAAIRNGVDLVQLRDKRLDERALVGAAKAAARLCKELGALFIVNDHPALALAAGADGVHVGQGDIPVREARALVGQDLLIGVSTHARAQIDAAGADYIGVGPVFATPTKPGRPAVGVELVRYAALHARVPFFAIGGIDARSLPDVLAAGARRVAVVRAIAHHPDPGNAASQLRRQLDAHDPPAPAPPHSASGDLFPSEQRTFAPA